MVATEKAIPLSAAAANKRTHDAHGRGHEDIIDTHALAIVTAHLGRTTNTGRATPGHVPCPLGLRMHLAVGIDKAC